MQRITRNFYDNSTNAQVGLQVAVTDLGNDTPQPFSVTDGGNTTRGEPYITGAAGLLDIYVQGPGARLTVRDAAGTVIFKEDIPGPSVANGIRALTQALV